MACLKGSVGGHDRQPCALCAPVAEYQYFVRLLSFKKASHFKGIVKLSNLMLSTSQFRELQRCGQADFQPWDSLIAWICFKYVCRAKPTVSWIQLQFLTNKGVASGLSSRGKDNISVIRNMSNYSFKVMYKNKYHSVHSTCQISKPLSPKLHKGTNKPRLQVTSNLHCVVPECQ